MGLYGTPQPSTLQTRTLANLLEEHTAYARQAVTSASRDTKGLIVAAQTLKGLGGAPIRLGLGRRLPCVRIRGDAKEPHGLRHHVRHSQRLNALCLSTVGNCSYQRNKGRPPLCSLHGDLGGGRVKGGLQASPSFKGAAYGASQLARAQGWKTW